MQHVSPPTLEELHTDHEADAWVQFFTAPTGPTTTPEKFSVIGEKKKKTDRCGMGCRGTGTTGAGRKPPGR